MLAVSMKLTGNLIMIMKEDVCSLESESGCDSIKTKNKCESNKTSWIFNGRYEIMFFKEQYFVIDN